MLLTFLAFWFNASPIVKPLFSLHLIVPSFIFFISDHSFNVCASPLNSIITLFVLLFACIFAFVKRQFDGS
nr:MAG TPA: hypothetical protein [Bacteriophage sp.]